MTEGAYLKNVVNKLGAFADLDPFMESDADIEAFARELLGSTEEEIIGKVLAHYPVSCINIEAMDHKKLDSLIVRFREKPELEQLLQIICHLRSTPKGKTTQIPVIERIKAYVEENLLQDVSVTAVAEQMNMSVYYLSHLFKSVTGTSVIEYRNELRLTKAKLLLIGTDMPINQIAQQTGFTNVSYFTEVFTGSEKIPPTEYRKYHR